MPILDFKEIPTAACGAARDQFELFAREFLEFFGFKTIVGPDRGPDAGRDLIVEEIRAGVAGETRLRWLVSCKHKAHSGASVTPDDERDVHDRVRTHRCSGFLGFYSAIPSSGLATKLNAIGLPFEVQIYEPERIEKELLKSATAMALAKRFFPVSLALWLKEHPSPAKIFHEEPDLSCLYCQSSLLLPKAHGIVVVWTSRAMNGHKDHTEHVYWCCKGGCDKVLQRQFWRKDLVDGWQDIPDLIIPFGYIRWVMALLNQLHGGTTYSQDALEKGKELLLNLYPLVCREQTTEEKERIERLGMLPDHFGGWGH
jgi:hypothetical protein